MLIYILKKLFGDTAFFEQKAPRKWGHYSRPFQIIMAVKPSKLEFPQVIMGVFTTSWYIRIRCLAHGLVPMVELIFRFQHLLSLLLIMDISQI